MSSSPTDPRTRPNEPQATGAGARSHASPAPLSLMPLTPEELADRLVPEDPHISADGRAVIFAVAARGMKGEHKTQAIWLSRDGAPAQPFTAGTAHDSNPRWSPDGSRMLFCSDRAKRGDESFQLYLMSIEGGEAHAVGELAGELTMPRWSPDGRTIAVLRKDPQTPEKERRQKERDDAIVVDEQEKQTRLWLVDVATGQARCLTYGTRQVWSYCWTHDGQHLVVLTTDSPDENAKYSGGRLWLLPVSGGIAHPIATFPALPGDPVCVETTWGAAIVVRANAGRADPSDSAWLVPLKGGLPVNLIPGLAGIVEEIVPLPGAPGRVGVRIVERTHGVIYSLDVVSGLLARVTPSEFHGTGSVLAGVSFSADGSRLAMIWSDSTTPEEVYVGEAAGTATAVTSFGERFRHRLSPTEAVRWLSTDGIEIEGLLTYPTGYEASRTYPLIVNIHGGPSWQWEDRVFLDWHDWAQLLSSHGYAVLAPNPRGSTGYGSAFQQLLQDDVGGGEAQDLISGAAAMVERGIADPDRLGIAGWSWGGYLTAWTITQTERFKAAVMGAGLANIVSDHGQDDIPAMNLLLYPGQPYEHMDHYWRTSPIRHVRHVSTPTLILHGDADSRVHPAQGMEFHRALKTLGVPVQFVRYPREGHSIKERAHQIDLMRRIVEWFDRWLKADGPTATVPTRGEPEATHR